MSVYDWGGGGGSAVCECACSLLSPLAAECVCFRAVTGEQKKMRTETRWRRRSQYDMSGERTTAFKMRWMQLRWWWWQLLLLLCKRWWPFLVYFLLPWAFAPHKPKYWPTNKKNDDVRDELEKTVLRRKPIKLEANKLLADDDQLKIKSNWLRPLFKLSAHKWNVFLLGKSWNTNNHF